MRLERPKPDAYVVQAELTGSTARCASRARGGRSRRRRGAQLRHSTLGKPRSCDLQSYSLLRQLLRLILEGGHLRGG